MLVYRLVYTWMRIDAFLGSGFEHVFQEKWAPIIRDPNIPAISSCILIQADSTEIELATKPPKFSR